MINWKYTLDAEGKELRQSIEGGDCKEVLVNIQNCLNVLKTEVTKEDQCWMKDIDAQLEELDNRIKEAGNLTTDVMDSRLTDFYNLMDKMRVWIGL